MTEEGEVKGTIQKASEPSSKNAWSNHESYICPDSIVAEHISERHSKHEINDHVARRVEVDQE